MQMFAFVNANMTSQRSHCLILMCAVKWRGQNRLGFHAQSETLEEQVAKV